MSKLSMARLRLDDFSTISKRTTKDLELSTNVVEWGKWARGGFPSANHIDSAAPNITDEQALLIDGIVCRMGSGHKFVLVELYIWQASICEIAEKIRQSNRYIMALRDGALNSLDGSLIQHRRGL